MSVHKNALGRQTEGTNETAQAAAISSIKIAPPPISWKPSDPGTYGLAISLGALPTRELRKMVNLLSVYGPAFGFHGRRRRDIAMRELQRRSAVR